MYTFATVRVHAMAETIEHRLIRSKHLLGLETGQPVEGPTDADGLPSATLVERHQHRPIAVEVRHVQPVALPTFLFEVNAKISCNGRRQ